MMKRQLNWMRQLAYTGSTGRAQEATEFLSEDLLQVEQRLEPAKRAAHNVHKRLQACLQGQSGADVDKRVKKLPLMTLSVTMAESFKELDPESSLGKALEMSCFIQSQLARVLAEFEIALERDVLQPLNKLSEEELPSILKHKKSLQKLTSDWNALKSRLNQATKNSTSGGTGLGGGPGGTSAANKLEMLKEEEEELKRKVEQCKDEYLADLYHFATKEDNYANYFISLLEIQANYHRQSLNSLDTALAELKESHGAATEPISPMVDTPVAKVYGVALEEHLKELGRDVALPLEACVMMLLAEGMREEGLFRLAAGASVLRRLKQTMAGDPSSLEEFCSDPHAVAGALKSYLRELPQPLMTFDLYDDWMRAASMKDPKSRLENLKEVCARLPKENCTNLRYLIRFLAKLAKEQEVNKMTPSNIAIVLGPNLLWPPVTEGDQAQLDAASVSSIQVVGVVEALIQNADTLFPGEIDFNVSGLFTGLTTMCPSNPEDKARESPPAEEPPARTTPPPAKEGRPVSEPENPPEAPAQAEDLSRKAKRPAPIRPVVPPPPLAHPLSSPPPLHSPSQASGSPATPKALPRRLAGSSLKAPSVPPPLPPQPVRRLSRPSLGSPIPKGETEGAVGTGPERPGDVSPSGAGAQAVDASSEGPQRRSLASEGD
ncbi:SH3 domain-binding protein 1 [Ornithorhynchus anatinus]|uniref:SH3 domain-binding protein 1 n=1 Tax=Ornithorhynchus anatinus TaxID=9258 RepID=UPI0010A7AD1B|nr:SH3 domain-binding protein 1 [Ornithorhynchus anatinus]